jgi:hypothetical protein
MAKEKEFTDEVIKADPADTVEENVETIKLSKKIKAGGIETDEIKMDFSKITGNMMVNAEKMARTLGEQSPAVMFSQTYQACIAAKVLNTAYSDVTCLPGRDFQKIIMAVNRFLFQ